MDRFTRNFLRIFAGIVGIVIIVWLVNLNPRVGELNNLLKDDNQLSKYPYQFKVLDLDHGVATLTSPRSAQVPAVRFLAIIFPHLDSRDTNSPDMIAAQKELANLQSKAKKLVLQQSDVNQVIWKIDQGWYLDHGIMLQ
jgi:hypothetical protein